MGYETAADIVAVAGITAVVDIATAGTIAVGSIAAGTAVVGSMTLGNGWTGLGGCYLPEHCGPFVVNCVPFVVNTLDAKPTTSSSFPSFFCGYQNRACFGIL